MSQVTAALLGMEHPHSIAHLQTLQLLPEVGRILLWDENPTALAEVQAQHGEKVAATFCDLDALLAEPDLRFVVAALRNDLGPAIFRRVLAAGKHLMTDKPIGRNAVEAQEIVVLAQQAGLQLGVCYQNRYTPWALDAKRFIEQGLLGELISVEMRMITTQVQFRNPQHWLFHKEFSGGGVLSWLGCHYIDLMRYLTGEEIVSVAAEVATRNGEAIDVEDTATLALRFANGALGSIHAGYILALSGGGYHNSNGYDFYGGINGRLGRLTWASSGTPSSIYVESRHPDWASAPQRTFHYTTATSAAYGGVYGEQFMRDFIRATQGQGSTPATGHDALQVARIVDAAYESSQSGRRVEI